MAAEQAHAHNHIAALRVMAIIHARHQLPAPAAMAEPNPALHYLRQALSVGVRHRRLHRAGRPV